MRNIANHMFNLIFNSNSPCPFSYFPRPTHATPSPQPNIHKNDKQCSLAMRVSYAHINTYRRLIAEKDPKPVHRVVYHRLLSLFLSFFDKKSGPKRH